MGWAQVKVHVGSWQIDGQKGSQMDLQTPSPTDSLSFPSYSDPSLGLAASSFSKTGISQPNRPGLQPSLGNIFPGYVRKNPRGYSYLCRLELQIEEQWPVGAWINLGQYTTLPGNSGGNVHVKFKLLKF